MYSVVKYALLSFIGIQLNNYIEFIEKTFFFGKSIEKSRSAFISSAFYFIFICLEHATGNSSVVECWFWC